MADSDFASLVSKDRNLNSVTNQMFVQLTNGTTGVDVTVGGELKVILAANSGVDIGDVDVTSVIPGVGATNLGKAVDSAGGATDTGVAALAIRDDALTTLTPVDGDYVRLRTTSTGALWVSLTSAGNTNIIQDDSAFTVGTSYVGASGYLADETTPDSVDEGDIGAARMTLDRKQLFVQVDATNDAQRQAISSAGAASVNLAQVLGATHSETNPVYVQVVNTAVSGSEVHDYQTTAAVVGDATTNHDYTVTGAVTLIKSVIWASSGGSKMELSVGPLASLVSKAVGFINKEGGVAQLFFDPPIEVLVASTGTARRQLTNRQGQAQDLYSTMIGNDVA